jgi:hypothetical protein
VPTWKAALPDNRAMRTRRRILTGVAIAAAIAALLGPGAASGSSSRPHSGLRGRVLFGPTCPVQRPGQSCTRPYEATIRILREPAKRLVARARSGADGRFSVRLAPGRYLLEPQSGHPYPRGVPQTVTVQPKRYTNVTISYDSGIR